MEGEITSLRGCFKANRHNRSCAHLPPTIQENQSCKRWAAQGHRLKGNMQVSEDNRKDGGQLTSEEQREGTPGCDCNELPKQKQTPTRSKKVPRAPLPGGPAMVQYESSCRQRAKGKKAGSIVALRALPQGLKRALWAQKEANMGPKTPEEGIRLLGEVSRTWGPKASCDSAIAITSFREHCCASWTTCETRPHLHTKTPKLYGSSVWLLRVAPSWSSQSPLQPSLKGTPCVQGKEGPR